MSSDCYREMGNVVALSDGEESVVSSLEEGERGFERSDADDGGDDDLTRGAPPGNEPEMRKAEGERE